MATVFRNHNSPIYRARFTNAEGKRVSRTTGTTSKREARKIAESYEAKERAKREEGADLPKAFERVLNAAAGEASSGTLTLSRTEELLLRLHRQANPDYREVTVTGWFREWIDQQAEHVQESSLRGYRNDLELLRTAFGSSTAEMSLSKLKADDLRNAISKAHQSRKAATVNKALRSFRRACEAAVAENLISRNVAKNVRPLKETDSTKKAPFSHEEIRKLIPTAEANDWFLKKDIVKKDIAGEWAGLITLAAFTGLRLGDLLRLEDKHVVGTDLQLVTEKTSKSLKIPLAPPCLRWIGERKGKFFPTLARQSKGTTSTQFTRLMAKAGIDRDVNLSGDLTARRSFHSLRHTFISWLADRGVNPDVRQKLTGHSSPGIHAGYSHYDEELQRAIEVLPAEL